MLSDIHLEHFSDSHPVVYYFLEINLYNEGCASESFEQNTVIFIYKSTFKPV